MGALVLVRHGQASFLADDYDQLSPVGEAQARLCGEHLARGGARWDAVYTGPRKRQRRTAEIAVAAAATAGLALPDPVTLEELDEMRAEEVIRHALPSLIAASPEVASLVESFATARTTAAGRDDIGRRFQSMYQTVITGWVRGEVPAPGIEPWGEFTLRVRRALARMRADGGAARGRRVIGFTSGGPVAAATQLALGLTDEATISLTWLIRNVSLTDFLFSSADAGGDGGERFTLHAFNALPDLPDPSFATYR